MLNKSRVCFSSKSARRRDCDRDKDSVFCRIDDQEFNLRIVGYADGAADPIDFPIAPKVATDRLLAATGIKVSVHS